MQTDKEQYLTYAQEAARWAAKADNERDRAALTQLARNWLEAALIAESPASWTRSS